MANILSSAEVWLTKPNAVLQTLRQSPTAQIAEKNHMLPMYACQAAAKDSCHSTLVYALALQFWTEIWILP